jgi:LysR family transcriptional regulator of gallate degradation
MELTRLTQFLALAEHRHFGRAAESLGLSQQALSKNIARLERSLKVKLFDRGPYGAVLTPYGETLQRRARVAEEELRLGRAELDAMRGSHTGRVVMGVGPTFVGGLMAQALLRMQMEHPGVEVDCRAGHSALLYPALLRGEVEMVASAPTAAVVADAGIRLEKLFVDKDTVVISARHPLARRRRVELADLQSLTWIMPSQLEAMHLRIARQFAVAGLEPPARIIKTDSIPLLLELVTRGNCITSISRDNVSSQVADGQLVELDVPQLLEARNAYIATRARSELQPAAAALLRHIRAVCRASYGRQSAADN